MDFRNTLPIILSQNIYCFTCAASQSMLRNINSFLIDENGNLVSFSKFKNKVYDVTNDFEVNDLESEYHTAIHCAQTADQWEGLQAFSALEYRTTGDKSDCNICKAFDCLTLATDDPLWDIILPPNHFGCRCLVLPGYEERIIKKRSVLVQKINDLKIHPYFKRNFGKENFMYDLNAPSLFL